MEFDVKSFAEHPTLTELEKCRKVDLILVADHFEVHVPLTAKKAEIRQLVVDKLREKGFLTELPSLEGTAAKADVEKPNTVPPVTPSPTNPPVTHGASAAELQLTLRIREMEVTSLGVATFSLCALSIDRFHAATGPGPLQTPKVEPCQSILSKLSVIWIGSMVLAAPELLLWQLVQEPVSLQTLSSGLQQNPPTASLMAALRARTDKFKVDVCVREPSEELPENIYSLVLTYHEARMWWIFGCYLCLPLLFTLACDLVTKQVLAQQLPQKPAGEKVTSRCSSSSSSTSTSTKKKQQVREQRLRSTVMALTILYVTCNLPESVCSITLAYISAHVSAALPALVLPALNLIGQFLLFVRCSATPVLLLFLCRSLGQAFMDCCCCCCEECLPDGNSSSSSSASTTATSNPSSPTSPTPSSLTPSSKEEVKSVLATETAALFDRAKDSTAAIGTPC